MRLSHTQRVIAVITVLMALAIAVLICSEVISRVYASVKRSENYFNTQQAWEYALGGEALAREVLAADFEKDRLSSAPIDHLHEKWAQPLPKMTVANGDIAVEIYDAQARLNLNNLIDQSGSIQSSQVGVLQRLMTFLGMQTHYADMAARWASYENDTENMYDSDKINYRAADTQFGSVSELRLLRDMRLEEYRRVAPYLSALPVPVHININTAPEPVLVALTDGSEQSMSAVKDFIAQRQQQEVGFTSTEAFSNLLDAGQGDDIIGDDLLSGDSDNGSIEAPSESVDEGENEVEGETENDSNAVLGTSSEYFEVRVIANYGKSKVWLVSTLFRDNETGEIMLLSRDTSQRFLFGNLYSKNNGANKDKKAKPDKEIDK